MWVPGTGIDPLSMVRYRMGPRIVGAEVGGAEVGGAEVKLDVTMWNVACDVSGWLFLMQMYWYVYTHTVQV